MTLTLQTLVYVAVVFFIYISVRPAYRIYFFAAFSLGYIWILNTDAAVAASAVVVYTYVCGLALGILRQRGSARSARVVCILSVVICIAALLVLKYADILHLPDGIIIPIGFSFYIFQAVSYLADIYTGKTEYEKNPFKMIVYLLWFPKFVSGPIERKAFFDEQISKAADVRLKDPDRWVRVIHYLLTGFFYKMVIADRLGILVDFVYAHYGEYDAAWLFAGMIMYSLQIYFDFAGYSYAAIGFSLIFGIELSENFRMPYLSANITEFWRRWHISLSSWLKDYVYIPLGGNRRGNVRKIINTLIVFVLCGIWHGESLSFVVWGLLHGIYSAIDSFFSEKGLSRIRSGIIGRIFTFGAVSFAWIFFRAQSVAEAVGYISGMLTPGRWLVSFVEDKRAMGLYIHDMVVLMVMIAVALGLEIAAYRKNVTIPELMIAQRYPVRYLAVFIMVLVIVIFGIYGPDTVNRLIYMQF